MNSLDWFLLGFLGLGLLLGYVRGTLKESISLASWLVGLYWADTQTAWVMSKLPIWTQNFNLLIAKSLILFAFLIAAVFIRWLVAVLLSDIKKTQATRFIGVFLALIKQWTIITVGVMIASFSVLPETESWKNSVVIAQIMPSQTALARHISDDTRTALSTLSTIKVSWQSENNS
jgi:uncharacterized membrane protein required for colicin V production